MYVATVQDFPDRISSASVENPHVLLFFYAMIRKLRERSINFCAKTNEKNDDSRALKGIQIQPVNSSPRNIVWSIDSMTNVHQ